MSGLVRALVSVLQSPDPGGACPGLPRVTVFAMYPPEGTQGGGVIMRDLLAAYPAAQVQWLSRTPSASTWRPEVARASFPARIRGLGALKPGRLLRVLQGVESATLAAWIRKRADDFRSEVLWLVLDSEVVPIAARLLEFYPGAVHLSIHDDPGVVWRMGPRDAAPRGGDRLLERCVRNATTLDVVSVRMQERFRTLTDAPISVLTRGFLVEDLPAEPLPIDTGAPPGIIMGGWYGPDPADATVLFEAYARLRAQLPAELHLVDRRLRAHATDGVTIYEWMEPAEYDRLLRGAAIGFAHDPTDGPGRAFAASSFSTKVVTYLGAGKPFIYHGPRDSTVGDLLERQRCGLIVESDDPDELAAAFVELLGPRYDEYARAAIAAAHEHFDLRMLRKRLYDTLRHSAQAGRR